MKLTSVVRPCLAAVLACSIALVGCKKRPERVTPIPGLGGPTVAGESTTPPIGPTTPVGPEKGTTGEKAPSTEGFPLSGNLRDYVPSAEQPFKTDTVYFDFDKSTVKPSEVPKLERIANGMKNYQGKALRVEGYCDERGTEEYNRSLGERRALAVREFLIRLGMSASSIDTISYGEDRPADPAHNEAAWAKNRRAEFVLIEPPGTTATK